ncbi:MAG: FumA C-terminus/TtdB family hydratase beta subunit [Omnitrophica bacterium]|nr:FumA C-terminus/TtdB family hydratase beta subunit [Candidatus Omnitrophota bacterium]
MKKVTTPLTKQARVKLKCGEEVLLSGTIYTARDAAHKELVRLINEKKKLPFELKDAVIYYAGPTPERADGSFGSCGPTTSSRMDKFTPALLDKGIAATIGKGSRSPVARNSIKKNKAIYFLAIGGAGAYLAKRITSSVTIAFKKLGPEAIYKLKVKDLPLIVGIDSGGCDIYA